MTDAPERIWAVPEYNCTVYMSGNSPITAQNGPFTHRRLGAAAAYIRADLVEALEAENQRLREALEAARLCLDFMAAGDDEAAGMAKRAISAMDRAALRSTREGG